MYSNSYRGIGAILGRKDGCYDKGNNPYGRNTLS